MKQLSKLFSESMRGLPDAKYNAFQEGKRGKCSYSGCGECILVIMDDFK